MAAQRWRQSGLGASHFRVAVLAVVALLILGYGIYRVGSVFDVFAERYVLYTPVPSVAGLREGAAVTLAGQRVGQVESIEFIPVEQKRDSNNVVMHLKVARSVSEQIRSDSRAHILTQGLIGDKYVDIDPGDPAARRLDPRDTLRAAPTVDLDRVLAMAAATMDTAQTVMTDLSSLVGPMARGEGTMGRLLREDALYDRLVGATTQLAVTLGRINAGEGSLGRALQDPTLYDNLNRAVLGLEGVTGQILNEEGSLGQLVRSDSLYRALFATVARADTAIAAVSLTLGGVTAEDGTLGRLITDPSLYEALLKAVVDVQILIQQIRDDPRQIRPEINVDVF